MHRTQIDQITSKVKPFQHHQTQRSITRRIGVVYGFLVPLIQPLRSILQNERIK
jgi:tetrahydromethanopterin S-methyltransferase subunit G